MRRHAVGTNEPHLAEVSTRLRRGAVQSRSHRERRLCSPDQTNARPVHAVAHLAGHGPQAGATLVQALAECLTEGCPLAKGAVPALPVGPDCAAWAPATWAKRAFASARSDAMRAGIRRPPRCLQGHGPRAQGLSAQWPATPSAKQMEVSAGRGQETMEPWPACLAPANPGAAIPAQQRGASVQPSHRSVRSAARPRQARCQQKLAHPQDAELRVA